MRNPERIQQLLSLIQKKWEKNPDLRLGQLLVGIAMRYHLTPVGEFDIFHVEDDKFIEALEKDNV